LASIEGSHLREVLVADNSAFRPRPRYHDPRLVAGAHAGIRASDADRDQLVEVLKTGFAEGRLSQDEYNVRMERAYTARTYGELGALVADLPRTAYGYPAYQPRKTNSLAVASLVCGLLEVFFGFTAIPAVILGHKALRQIRQTGEPGTGMAKAGLVLGWAAITIFVILVALAVLGVVVATSHSGSAVPSSGTHLLPLIRPVPPAPPAPPAG
jgi:uncharacterized membrane protein